MKKRILLFFLVLLVCFLSSCSVKHYPTYEELDEKYVSLDNAYDELKYKYENLLTDVGKFETPLLTLNSYFEYDDCTFSEAHDALLYIRKLFDDILLSGGDS